MKAVPLSLAAAVLLGAAAPEPQRLPEGKWGASACSSASAPARPRKMY